MEVTGGVIREATRLEKDGRELLKSLEVEESAIRNSDVVETTELILELSSFFGFGREGEEEERGESSLSFLGRLETEEEGFCLDFLGSPVVTEEEPGLEEAGRSLREEDGVFSLRDFEGTSMEGLEAEEEESLGRLVTLERGGDELEMKEIKNSISK